MSKRNSGLLLLDMLESAEKITKYTSDYDYDQFISDDKTVDAVIRNFEIIGEAANRIELDFKLQHDEIQWRKLRGFRNRIVHDYFGIDYEIVWSIVEFDIEILTKQLKVIINETQK